MGRKATKGSTPKGQKKLTFREMVTSAIENLKDKSGSSRVDIVKYICANYDTSNVWEEVVNELKKGLKDGYILSCSKGRSRMPLYALNTMKATDKDEGLKDKGKTDGQEKADEQNKKANADEEPSTSNALTRAKLPIKVKEKKEKKRAEAMAKRAAKPKSTKKGRRRNKKNGNSSKSGTSSTSSRAIQCNERGIPLKMLDAFEEIWKNM
ncbi:hypothetical protein ACF0H5_012726 [Mactra antiquata]